MDNDHYIQSTRRLWIIGTNIVWIIHNEHSTRLTNNTTSRISKTFHSSKHQPSSITHHPSPIQLGQNTGTNITMTTRDNRFEGKATRFKLFVLTHHCYPSKGHKDNHDSRLLGNWVAKQRRLYRRGNLLPDRISVLESVDPDFFSQAARGRRVKPLSWDLFVTRNAGPSQKAAIKYFTDHQGRPYVTSYNSIARYMVSRLDISDVCPSFCNPDSPFGSIERVLSFVLHHALRSFRHEAALRTSWTCRDDPVCESVYFSGATLYTGDEGKSIIDKAATTVPYLLIQQLRGSTEKSEASTAIYNSGLFDAFHYG
jgi:hypothetical protein